MKENRQQQFYKILGQELTKARERKNMSAYDLSKFVGEQWTTINKMEAGGKFMAHHFVWLKEIGVNLNILISDVTIQLESLPESEGEIEVEQEKVKPPKGKRKPTKTYQSIIEEPDHYGGNDPEDLGDLF